jgi:hypothetical protein
MASVPYREAVGALWYIARGTRFDLFRACQEVARFVDNPGPVHWRAVLRAYAYLARTRTKPLVMKSSGLRSGSGRGGIDLRVSGNSDADWAGCPSTSKSHTGWIVRFGGSLVSWRAALQGSVSQSSCEAEYVAGAALGNELVWWRLLCEDMGYPPTGPYPSTVTTRRPRAWPSTLGASRRRSISSFDTTCCASTRLKVLCASSGARPLTSGRTY